MVPIKNYKYVFGVLISLIIIYVILLLQFLFLRGEGHPESQKRTKDLKTILLWNPLFEKEDYGFGFGKQPFLDNNCPVSECFLTNRRNFTYINKFDAIVFHGPGYYPASEEDYPAARNPSQIYVFLSMESPDMFPVYNFPNDFFNTTITYRMDSDIAVSTVNLVDMEGNIISPAWHPKWKSPESNTTAIEEFVPTYRNKTKPVAWIVSECNTTNNRMAYAKELQGHVAVDIYGNCDVLKCEPQCETLLKNDYFFVLSFEKSNCQDYVTDIIYTALNNDVVPIIVNGANMMKFLPPYSFIDARQFSPTNLAERINWLISDPREYLKYFWWKKYYKPVLGPQISPFCDLCKMLHNPIRRPQSYDNLVDWFHGTSGNPMCH